MAASVAARRGARLLQSRWRFRAAWSLVYGPASNGSADDVGALCTPARPPWPHGPQSPIATGREAPEPDTMLAHATRLPKWTLVQGRISRAGGRPPQWFHQGAMSPSCPVPIVEPQRDQEAPMQRTILLGLLLAAAACGRDKRESQEVALGDTLSSKTDSIAIDSAPTPSAVPAPASEPPAAAKAA